MPRRRALLAAGGGIVAAGAGVVLVLSLVRPGVPSPTTAGTADTALAPAVQVCGFEGPLIGKVVADAPADAERASLTSWVVAGDGALAGLAVTADAVIVEREVEPGTMTVLRFSREGRSEGAATLRIPRENASDVHGNGRWGVGDDGSVYAIDSYDGHRDVIRFGTDGQVAARLPVPDGSETSGHPLDLQNVTWVDDLDGAPALLVGEGSQTTHALRPDGTSLGVLDSVPGTVLGTVGASEVVQLEDADTGAASLTVQDVATGTSSLRVVYSTVERAYGQSATPAPNRLGSVVAGPEGEGFLVSSADGVEWVDAAGIRRGIWLSGQSGIAPASPASLVEADGRYWMLVTVDGEERVAALTADEMRARLAEPVVLAAANDGALAQLGIGLGAVTDATLNHVDDGTAPRVELRAEPGWGEGLDANAYEVRYTVRGDPTLPAPVMQEERAVDIPIGGGSTPLSLPAPRPGAYEVSLAVVDTATGAPVSGSCLRYSIGAPGAAFDLDALADGADWGGAGPLRGIQLADRLGVGSHRVQLDFGRLVPDPGTTPDRAAVDWSALPGATDDDPWHEVRAAGEYAAAHDLDLVVQVASGGDAERAAVDAGTWSGWAAVIVGEFARQATPITHWSAWNEPNIGFDSGADYAERVEIPFADAAHAAVPGAIVLGLNTLGFADDWWTQAADAGVCDHIDAVAVHPYTGWNRSWEEEGFAEPGAGFDALREAVGPTCAALPIWDTETGWTADGPVAFWAQGSDVARKLLWYDADEIAGWTYFFSEGGWGESGLSWSLIQYEGYVKPGALAFRAVSGLLDGRGTPETVDLGIPFTHAMRVPGDDSMLAVWTDEARLPARVTTDAAALTVTDEYGATDRLDVTGGSAEVVLTATPQFFRVPSGAALDVSSVAFGPDLLAGRPVEASSTHEDADAQVITSGTADPYRPWRSGRAADGGLDEQPTVTVSLAEPTRLDRIAVATGNLACCETGLRDYTVSVRDPSGDWHVVAEQRDQFWVRTVVFEFDAVEATAVRVQVPWTTVRGTRILDVNYSALAGGLPPPFLGLATESDYLATISAIQAFAPAP